MDGTNGSHHGNGRHDNDRHAHGRAPTLTFLGAAGTVTGSKHLVETADGARVLVDAGLFQGPKALRLRNWEPMAINGQRIDAASIDAIVLTHAHIDHCGAVPRLVREGFTGPVYATPGTVALARIVLPDSGHLHEEEAAYANRVGYSRHRPALPLYTEADAIASLAQFVEVPFGEPRQIVPGLEVTWHHAGHILGAAWVDLRVGRPARRIVFSGDLGRGTHPLLGPPTTIDATGGPPVDVIVCESTYGDDEHPDDDVDGVLVDVVTAAARRGGAVLVPAFAVDRTEVVLHHLDRLVAAGAIPPLPVVLDSPMASAALGVYRHEAAHGSSEFRPEVTRGRLFAHLDLTETRTPEESKALNEHHGPIVIVSASGMATGGRILHHLAVRMGDPRTTILLVGFQAPGTRGAALADGATTIKLLGAHRPVGAEVRSIPLSSHADRSELLDWIGGAVPAAADGSAGGRPRGPLVYVVHGEPEAAAALADGLARERHLPAVVARHGERVRLDVGG
jgi:metallo-beta-lactamase family protein